MLSRPTRSILTRRLLHSLPARSPLPRAHATLPSNVSISRVSCRRYAFHPRRPQYNRFQEAGALWRSSPPFRAVVIVSGGGIVVWIGSNMERVPVSGRWRFNCVDEAYEAELGRQGYREVMRDYQDMIISPRDPRHEMVGRVLTRLLPNSGLRGGWEYHVIDDDDEMNAFVIPGGKVFVYSGLLPICKNEDGLAAVLGHEIAHNMCHHVQESASLPYLVSLFAGLATIFVDNSAGLQFVLRYALALPNSRAQEAEADRLGLLIMAQSCYNPEEAIRLWERFDNVNKDASPQLLSTHPTHKNRIKRIQQWLPEAIQKQNQSECGEMNILSDQFSQALQTYNIDAFPR